MAQPTPRGHEQVVKVRVPTEEISVVNFPGIVRNDERAMDLLGGADSIANVLRQSSAPLKCRPRGVRSSNHLTARLQPFQVLTSTNRPNKT